MAAAKKVTRAKRGGLAPADVRKLALALPEAEEQDHHGRPSFRVKGKIFATLWVAERRAVLKLLREEQDDLVQAEPEVFGVTPWGLNGWTLVELAGLDRARFRDLLELSWRRVAPKRLGGG
jgi:hypothetical protein